jgi:hypothetical protein
VAWFVGWLVSWSLHDHFLLRDFGDFGPYGIIFINLWVVVTVSMVILLKNFGPCGLLFITLCLLLSIFLLFFIIHSLIFLSFPTWNIGPLSGFL